jgi:hypothetical protein
MGHAHIAAEIGNELRFTGAFRAQAMVDGGHFEPAAPRGIGQQQQGEAVGPAGNGKAQPSL